MCFSLLIIETLAFGVITPDMLYPSVWIAMGGVATFQLH
jgi:hypothetical protein